MAAKTTAPVKSHPGSLLFGSQARDELFSKGLRLSVAAHGLVVIAAIILSLTSAKEPVKMIQSIRVDLVGLPDLKKSDLSKITPDDISDLNEKLTEAGKNAKDMLKKAKERPPAEPEPVVKDDSMAMKKTKTREKERGSDLKSAIDRIKALADIESQVKKSKTVAKGNAVSRGNSLSGEAADDANEFAARIASKLRDNWNLPIWLSKQKLNAKVVIFLDRAGYVSNTVFAQSSGNKQFDDYCLKTVRMAQPFGPPPSEILDGGITLGFPL